jgi:hypothetical protein
MPALYSGFYPGKNTPEPGEFAGGATGIIVLVIFLVWFSSGDFRGGRKQSIESRK